MTIIIKDNKLAESLHSDTLKSIELLLYRETDYLDQGDYENWLSLFTEDCIYWVPAEPGQTDPENHISLFYEDRAMMKVRITKLQHPQSHPMSYPLRCNHIVGDRVIEVIVNDTEELIVTSRFLMTEYYRNEQRNFAGKYEYRLIETDGDYKIRMKRVNLINCDALLEPIQVFI